MKKKKIANLILISIICHDIYICVPILIKSIIIFHIFEQILNKDWCYGTNIYSHYKFHKIEKSMKFNINFHTCKVNIENYFEQ